MAKGDLARGGKGHATRACLDTNGSSFTTCTCMQWWKSKGDETEEVTTEEQRNRH